jgi:hypothetical protein
MPLIEADHLKISVTLSIGAPREPRTFVFAGGRD